MMSNKVKLLFLLGGLVSGSLSCSWFGNTDDWPRYEFPQEFREYVQFPEGSYWVYQDSVSGELDTICLLTQKVSIDPAPGQTIFKERLQELRFRTFTRDTIVAIGAAVGEHTIVEALYYVRTLAPGSAEKDVYMECDKPFDDPGGISFLKCLDSLTVNNQKYLEVKVFESTTPLEGYDVVISYWARNVGMVKKVMQNGRVWVLTKLYIP